MHRLHTCNAQSHRFGCFSSDERKVNLLAAPDEVRAGVLFSDRVIISHRASLREPANEGTDWRMPSHPPPRPPPASCFSSHSSSTKSCWSWAQDWDRRWGGAQITYTCMNAWASSSCMYGSNTWIIHTHGFIYAQSVCSNTLDVCMNTPNIHTHGERKKNLLKVGSTPIPPACTRINTSKLICTFYFRADWLKMTTKNNKSSVNQPRVKTREKPNKSWFAASLNSSIVPKMSIKTSLQKCWWLLVTGTLHSQAWQWSYMAIQDFCSSANTVAMGTKEQLPYNWINIRLLLRHSALRWEVIHIPPWAPSTCPWICMPPVINMHSASNVCGAAYTVNKELYADYPGRVSQYTSSPLIISRAWGPSEAARAVVLVERQSDLKCNRDI